MAQNIRNKIKIFILNFQTKQFQLNLSTQLATKTLYHRSPTWLPPAPTVTSQCQPTHQGTSVTCQPRCTIRALPTPQVPRSRGIAADSSLKQKHSVSSRGNVVDSSRVHHCSRSSSMLSSVCSSVCSSVFSCRMKSKDRNPATSPSDKGGGELSSFGDKIPNISSLGNSFKGF